jgi:hypothetical protein
MVKWESVVWNEGDKWRAGLGLDRKFFHVTISTRDDHSLLKGIQSVIDRLGVDELVDRLENMSAEAMQEVFHASRNGYTELEYGPPLFVSHLRSINHPFLHSLVIVPIIPTTSSTGIGPLHSLRISTNGFRRLRPKQGKVGVDFESEC